MSQHDYTIANQGFPATRADINNALSAIATNNSGTSAPSTQYAGQFWIDTTSSTWTLYIHDGSDDIQFTTIDTSANTVNFVDSALDVVTDTSPQLGGNLDLNSNNITGTGNINITGSITSNGVNTSSFNSVDISGELNLNATGTNIIDFAGTGTNFRWLNSNPVFESVFTATRNAEISLKYNGAEKLATTSTGIDVTGNIEPDANDTYDLGASGNVWRNIYTGDLHLSNEAKSEGNAVDGTKGNWTIQEGAEDLYILNNKTGKKYKFKLEEIS